MCATGYPRRRHQKNVCWPASMACAARAGAVARQVRVAAAQPPRKTARGRGTGGVRRDRPRAHRARACGSNPRRRGRPTKGVTPLAAWGRLARPHGESAPHRCARHADTPTRRRCGRARGGWPRPLPPGHVRDGRHRRHRARTGSLPTPPTPPTRRSTGGAPQRTPLTADASVAGAEGGTDAQRDGVGAAAAFRRASLAAHGLSWGPPRIAEGAPVVGPRRRTTARPWPCSSTRRPQRIAAGADGHAHARREARRQRPPARRGGAPRDAAAARRGGRPTHGGGCGCRGGGGSTPPRPTRRRRVGGWRPPPRPRGRTARRVARARLAWPWRLG